MTDQHNTTIPASCIEAAKAWVERHPDHVARLAKSARSSFEPYAEDMHHPELWKAESWKWLKESGL